MEGGKLHKFSSPGMTSSPEERQEAGLTCDMFRVACYILSIYGRQQATQTQTGLGEHYLRRGSKQDTLEEGKARSSRQVVQVAILQLWRVCEGQLMQGAP